MSSAVVQTTASCPATGREPAANAYWYISASLSLSFQRYVCESWYIWSLYAGSAGSLLSVGLIVSYLIKEVKSRPSISHELRTWKESCTSGRRSWLRGDFKLPFFSVTFICTLKNKDLLLASMVQQRSFTIHGTFAFHKRFFTMEGSLDY